MAENSKIEWTDHTVNFWWGCSKVSPACANCYAEALDARFHGRLDTSRPWTSAGRKAVHWGAGAPRLLRVEAAQKEAMRYQHRAEKQARRFRVFTNSMADFFEDRLDLDRPRAEALTTTRITPHLDWLILTKRPERIIGLLVRTLDLWKAEPSTITSRSMVEWLQAWIDGHPPANIWIGTTVENQEWADKRIPALLQVPAAVRFLSCEPLLGPVDLSGEYLKDQCGGEYPFPMLEDQFRTKRIDRLDWVICGGESGPKARPMHSDWARDLRDQCQAAGVPYLFKQWGQWIDASHSEFGRLPAGEIQHIRADGTFWDAVPESDDADCLTLKRVSKERAGRLLDGAEHNGVPVPA